MTNIFENATFGTRLQTREGGDALYIAHIKYNNTHKVYVQGLEYTQMYNADGTKRGGGRYAGKNGFNLDIVKVNV